MPGFPQSAIVFKDITPLLGGPVGVAACVARLFDLEIGEGRFVYHYDEQALAWDELLAGRYVLTSGFAPRQADTARVVAAYRQLTGVEKRSRTVGDFLKLRPLRR